MKLTGGRTKSFWLIWSYIHFIWECHHLVSVFVMHTNPDANFFTDGWMVNVTVTCIAIACEQKMETARCIHIYHKYGDWDSITFFNSLCMYGLTQDQLLFEYLLYYIINIFLPRPSSNTGPYSTQTFLWAITVTMGGDIGTWIYWNIPLWPWHLIVIQRWSWYLPPRCLFIYNLKIAITW